MGLTKRNDVRDEEIDLTSRLKSSGAAAASRFSPKDSQTLRPINPRLPSFLSGAPMEGFLHAAAELAASGQTGMEPVLAIAAQHGIELHGPIPSVPRSCSDAFHRWLAVPTNAALRPRPMKTQQQRSSRRC